MEAIQPIAKLFTGRAELPARELIAVWHRWIQSARLPGVNLFDVADYSHVADGPEVLLVAQEGFLSLDRVCVEGHPAGVGLSWRVRRGVPVDAAVALRGAVSVVLRAAMELEKDSDGRIQFATDALLVGFDDRLRAPNDEATFAAARPALDELASTLFGAAGLVRPDGDPKACFRAIVSGPAAPLADLAPRLR